MPAFLRDPLVAPSGRVLVAGSLVVLVGVGAAVAPPAASMLAILPIAVLMMRSSASVWVASAVVVAVLFPGLAWLGLVPRYAQFLHLLLAWGALFIALIHRRRTSSTARRCLIWLGILGLAVVVSTTVNTSQPIRGVAYFVLLAEPFAMLCALLLDPPSSQQRRMLVRVCAVLVAVQIPLAYWQMLLYGRGDAVAGTLTGLSAGAHVMAAIVFVGAIWYLGRTSNPFTPLSLGVLTAMTGILVIADAKQVIFALPAVVIAQRSISSRSIVVGLITVSVLVLVIQSQTFSGGYAVPYIHRALSGETGKVRVAGMIWGDAAADPGTLLFGQGPAETVSRAAYETVPEYQKSGSALGVLGIKPALKPYQAEAIAVAAVKETGKSAFVEPFNLDSFDSGTSSGVGLFGDLGLFGFAAYGGLYFTVFLRLRRQESAEALAAASGFAMLIVLGFVLDWWEQPPFMLFLATLAGLALTALDRNPMTARTPTPDRLEQARRTDVQESWREAQREHASGGI